MPVEVIESLEDSRLDPYRNLKATNRTRWSSQFIAEGMLVVERLLTSDFQVVSVLASRRTEGQVLSLVAPTQRVFLLEHGLAEQLVGYTFHTGVLACGLRKPSPALARLFPHEAASGVVAVCPNVNDPENIGAIIRLCAGFGVLGLLLGRGCADPFSRRVLRVSMGTAFTLPIIESQDLETDLLRLRNDLGVELSAAVLDAQAEALESIIPSGRTAILFGNEKHGLDSRWIAMCQRKLTIPMSRGADSLNVAVAAGIFFHQLLRVLPQRSAI